jgi:hypothetical protein
MGVDVAEESSGLLVHLARCFDRVLIWRLECLSMAALARAFLATSSILLFVVAALLCTPAKAEERVALVVGNGAYRYVPALRNPANDARDIAASLERLGFKVHRVLDASFEDMRRALLELTERARTAEIAVVFFAGHGMEIGGENWLIPIDAQLKTDLDIEQETVALKSVMSIVAAASKLGLVMLDACRNNPFAAKMERTGRSRAVGRGLARVEPRGSVLVVYAAREGTTAEDGLDRNSPFTAALLKYIGTPGLEVNFLFRAVRDDVLKATKLEQEPFVYGTLSKQSIYLNGPPTVVRPASAEEAIWDLLKDTSDVGALKRFIRQFPASTKRADAERRISELVAEAKKQSGAPAQVAAPPASVLAFNVVNSASESLQISIWSRNRGCQR